MTSKELQLTVARCKKNVLRMVRASGHGHLGGAFSCLDVVTALYFNKMKCDPSDPKMPTRDRFILSAGHKCMAQYSVLAEKGFIPKEWLDTYGSLGCHLPGHPDMYKCPGIEANTGALGHGLAIGCGMALGMRVQGIDSQVYVVMGDGELCEGSNWEAAAAAAHHKIDNITLFLDYNGLQISGRVKEVMDMEPIVEKFESFGWAVKEIDGNNMDEILETLDQLPLTQGKPTAVVMRTVKAKGISFAEDNAGYHFWAPKDGELEQAEKEIDALIAGLEAEL